MNGSSPFLTHLALLWRCKQWTPHIYHDFCSEFMPWERWEKEESIDRISKCDGRLRVPQLVWLEGRGEITNSSSYHWMSLKKTGMNCFHYSAVWGKGEVTVKISNRPWPAMPGHTAALAQCADNEFRATNGADWPHQWWGHPCWSYKSHFRTTCWLMPPGQWHRESGGHLYRHPWTGEATLALVLVKVEIHMGN